MGRPALSDDELISTQQEILSAAARLIASGGYTALSMRRLAEGVGLTAAALYRYFPTKQQVLNAYWTGALEELNRALADIDRRETGHAAAVRAMLRAFADFGLADADRFRLMFLENDLGAMDELGQRPETFAGFDLLMKRVAAGIAAGEFRTMPADRATFILWGAVHGVVSLSIAVKELDFGDVRDLARLAADTALRGLAPAPTPARSSRK